MAITAKRRLTDMNFETEGAHVALVSKTLNGGAANGKEKAVILKALKPTEGVFADIEKAKVQVTLPFEEFLRKFFNMWYEDSEILSALLGMDEPKEEIEYDDNWYEDYIQSKVDSFIILKSLNESESLEKAFAELKPEELLLVLQDQAKIETVFKSYEKKKDKKASKPKTKKETMSTEMIEKSQYSAIVKELEDNRAALQKALEIVAEHEKEKKTLIAKARKDSITEVVKNETSAETLFKNLEALSDETFVSTMEVIKALATAADKIERSRLFDEIGASGDAVAPQSEASSALLKKALKARLSINK